MIYNNEFYRSRQQDNDNDNGRLVGVGFPDSASFNMHTGIMLENLSNQAGHKITVESLIGENNEICGFSLPRLKIASIMASDLAGHNEPGEKDQAQRQLREVIKESCSQLQSFQKRVREHFGYLSLKLWGIEETADDKTAPQELWVPSNKGSVVESLAGFSGEYVVALVSPEWHFERWIMKGDYPVPTALAKWWIAPEGKPARNCPPIDSRDALHERIQEYFTGDLHPEEIDEEHSRRLTLLNEAKGSGQTDGHRQQLTGENGLRRSIRWTLQEDSSQKTQKRAA